MRKLLPGLVAGAGAWKLGGGCLSTILIFIILRGLLRNFAIFNNRGLSIKTSRLGEARLRLASRSPQGAGGEHGALQRLISRVVR